MYRKHALIFLALSVLPFSLTACEFTVNTPDDGGNGGEDGGGNGGGDNGGGGGGGGGGGNGGGGSGSGNSGSVSVTLTADPVSGTIPFEVTFRADAESSNGSDIAYLWTVPSGEVRAGATYTTLIAEPGEQEFSVTASNGGDRATASVTIQALEPTLEPGNERPVLDNDVQVSPEEGTSPLEVTFTARASDPNGDTLDYIWDFGDGSDPVGGDATISHTYEDPSYYPVKVFVSDGRGGVDSTTAEVFVNPPPATINLDIAPNAATWEVYNYYWYDDEEGYGFYESGTGDATITVPSYYDYEIYVYAEGHESGYDYIYLEPGDTENIEITLEPNEDEGGGDGSGSGGVGP